MTNNSQAGPAIALAGVNLSLGQGAARVHILKDIELNIGTGEAIGLIGPSGSGKSTLLMVMAGLERADSGTVSVAGENLTSAQTNDLSFSKTVLSAFITFKGAEANLRNTCSRR